MLARLFPQNEHVVDRTLRVAIGLILIALVFVGPKSLFGLVGIVPLLTGAIGSCPIYTIFGVGTCAVPGRKSPPAS